MITVKFAIEIITDVSQRKPLPVFGTDGESRKLAKMFPERNLSGNVTFRIGRKEVKAHKSVLSKKSEVFNAMLRDENFVEGRSGVVEITDFTPEKFEQFMSFLYKSSNY